MKIPRDILDEIQELSCEDLKKIMIVIIGKLYRLLGGNGVIAYWNTIKSELKIK